MYNFVEPIGANLSSVGRGNKSPERKALEELPIGKAVNIPKEKASRGSMQNWTWDIGRKRGIKLSCRSFGDNWHVTATSLVPTPCMSLPSFQCSADAGELPDRFVNFNKGENDDD